MDQRREYRNRDKNKFWELQKVITEKCRQAKDDQATKACKEIEALREKQDDHNIFKTVKEMCGIFRNRTPYQLLNKEIKICNHKKH